MARSNCSINSLGKPCLIDRKRLIEPDAGHLPMARGGVLARRARGAFAEIARGRLRRRQVRERLDIRKPQAHEVRQRQRA